MNQGQDSLRNKGDEKMMTYPQGHGMKFYMIKNMLENLGCKNIVRHDFRGKETQEVYKPCPDIVCNYGGKKVAVEVGNLNSVSPLNSLLSSEANRIEKHFENFDAVIHIFADSKLPVVHCVMYRQSIHKLRKKLLSIIHELELFLNWFIRENRISWTSGRI